MTANAARRVRALTVRSDRPPSRRSLIAASSPIKPRLRHTAILGQCRTAVQRSQSSQCRQADQVAIRDFAPSPRVRLPTSSESSRQHVTRPRALVSPDRPRSTSRRALLARLCGSSLVSLLPDLAWSRSSPRRERWRRRASLTARARSPSRSATSFRRTLKQRSWRASWTSPRTSMSRRWIASSR